MDCQDSPNRKINQISQDIDVKTEELAAEFVDEINFINSYQEIQIYSQPTLLFEEVERIKSDILKQNSGNDLA